MPEVTRGRGEVGFSKKKSNSEMIPGLCIDLLAFTLELRETPENLS